MATMRTTGRGAPPPDSALARLVHTEARLDEFLATRRAEADALVADARRRADAILAEAEADLAALVAGLNARLERDRLEALASLRQEAEDRLHRLMGIDEERIDALARWVADRVLAELRAAP